ncbi:MAG: hypothetical protein SPJ29_06810 [Phocaeicola sp.]|nr:hypothetical protein [Phocaeicola sp.]MDD7447738.1 hypothetical protein [Prevotellaceae bacterium]MDY3914289.1 hypothetical protein [Phocaeicola sp.]MDY5939444.1 hypothetical protein [Phocaeicola sp.]
MKTLKNYRYYTAIACVLCLTAYFSTLHAQKDKQVSYYQGKENKYEIIDYKYGTLEIKNVKNKIKRTDNEYSTEYVYFVDDRPYRDIVDEIIFTHLKPYITTEVMNREKTRFELRILLDTTGKLKEIEFYVGNQLNLPYSVCEEIEKAIFAAIKYIKAESTPRYRKYFGTPDNAKMTYIGFPHFVNIWEIYRSNTPEEYKELRFRSLYKEGDRINEERWRRLLR